MRRCVFRHVAGQIPSGTAQSDSRPDVEKSICLRIEVSRRSTPAADVRVTRSNLPSRSRTHCENETPSSSSGFGSKSQTTDTVIPSETRDLAHGALITLRIECAPRTFERSLSPSRTGVSFEMTRVFILFNSHLFGHADPSTDAEPLYLALIHRFGEHRRDDEFAAVGGFNLVINLEHATGRGPEKYRAIFPNIDIIDSVG